MLCKCVVDPARPDGKHKETRPNTIGPQHLQKMSQSPLGPSRERTILANSDRDPIEALRRKGRAPSAEGAKIVVQWSLEFGRLLGVDLTENCFCNNQEALSLAAKCISRQTHLKIGLKHGLSLSMAFDMFDRARMHDLAKKMLAAPSSLGLILFVLPLRLWVGIS